MSEVERVLAEEKLPSLEAQARLVLEALESHADGALIEPEICYPAFGAAGPKALERLLAALVRERYIATLLENDEQTGKTVTGYVLDLAGAEKLKAGSRAPRGATGWDKVDRQLTEAEERLGKAAAEEQFQSVGHLCRETLISLGQSVYKAGRHPSPDDKTPSKTDAARVLEAYISVELAGAANEEARRLVKVVESFTSAVTHKRSASFRDAALCMEATRSLVEMIAIIEGKRDRG